MAEAALAFSECEFQIDTGLGDLIEDEQSPTNYAKITTDGAHYIRERDKLWDAFVAARAKAKGVDYGHTCGDRTIATPS